MSQLKNILIGLFLVLLQITLLNLLTIRGVKPDLVILFVIARALVEGPTAGIAWGFGFGLLLDTISGGLTGLGALAYSLAGFIAGKIGPGTIMSRLRYLSVVTLCTSVTFSVFLYFRQPWDTVGWAEPILTNTMPSIIYTWLLALVWIYSPFGRLPAIRDRG
jgi:rod shape-determining protein MreD